MSLVIRKKGVKNFFHYWDSFTYSASDLTIITSGNTVFLRAEDGRVVGERGGWALSTVSVYDDTNAGSQEVFANVTALTNRLIALGYPAYYVDGEVNWGNVGGSIENQSDLISYINSVLPPTEQTSRFVGDITLVSGYTYSAYQQNSVINGTLFPAYVSGSITLTTADGTHPRFDVIVFESDGTFDKVTGTAATNPTIPIIDVDTQVAVRIVYVPASSTTESGVTQDLVYNDDVGTPTEYNVSGTANVNVASTEHASTGTKSIKFTSATTSDSVTATDSSTHDGNAVTQIKYKVYITTSANYRHYVQIEGEPSVLVQNGLYGFDTSVLNQWQQIIIPASAFSGLSALTYDEIKIINGRNNTTFFIDDWYIVEGFTGNAVQADYTLGTDSSGNLALLKDGIEHSIFNLDGGTA